MRVQRVNFIEKEPLDFTYQKILFIGLGVLFLCGLLFGAQKGRAYWYHKQVAVLTEEVNRMKVEQERIRRATASESGGLPVTARAALIQLFENDLPWSPVLKELTSLIPPSLWLSSLKSYDKADSPTRRGILLNGQTEEVASLARFLKLLSDSPDFEKVVLTSSTQDKTANGLRYQFAIDVAVSQTDEVRP